MSTCTDLVTFKLQALIKGGENLDVAESKETLSAWEEIQEKLQNLRPADAKRKALENEEIPALDVRLKELDKQIPEFRMRADEVNSPMFSESLVNKCWLYRNKKNLTK